MIPDGWSEHFLGDVCKISSGVGFPLKFQGRKDLPIPFIKVSDMNSEGNEKYVCSANNTIDNQIQEYIKAPIFPKGCLVLPKVGAALLTNKRRILAQPTAVDNNVMVLMSKSVNYEFLYYWSLLIDMADYVQSGALPSINKSTISQIQITLPPEKEQKKIATILTSVDDAIQATQGVIDQTRRVKQGLLQQLLTRGIGHSRFKQTEIGEIPEGWAIVKLGDVANESKERFIPNGNEIYTYVGLKHMKSGINRIARTGLSSDVSSSKTVFKVGDTLFGKLRPYLKKVALSDIFGVCSTDIIAISPSEQIDPYFLCAVLSSDSAISHSIESSAGTKMPRTSWKEMSNFNVLLPKIIEQKKIAAVLKSLDEVLQIEQTKLQQNIKIKRGLMQDLLTGRVRVKPDEVNTT